MASLAIAMRCAAEKEKYCISGCKSRCADGIAAAVCVVLEDKRAKETPQNIRGEA